MKIIVIFLLLTPLLNYSQHPISGVVEYKIELKDSLNKIKNEDVKMQKKIEEAFKETAYFILEFNTKESSYKNKEKLMNIDQEKLNNINFLQIIGGGKNCNFYSNIENKITEVQFQPFGEQLIVSYNFPEWEITEETKFIDQYKCFKAYKYYKGVLNKKDEIWFTPEIPFQFGPNKYVGLPGLVLEVNNGKIRFIAEKISLEFDKKIKIEKPNKGTRLTDIEFDIKVKEMAKEFGF